MDIKLKSGELVEILFTFSYWLALICSE